MSAHVCETKRDGERWVARCAEHAVAFRFRSNGYAVTDVEVATPGNPAQRCPGVIAAVERAAGVQRWQASWAFEQGEMLGAFKTARFSESSSPIATSAGLMSGGDRHACGVGSVASNASTVDVENSSEARGAGRVSPPLQSAVASATPLSHQGRPEDASRLCSDEHAKDVGGEPDSRPVSRPTARLLANQVDTLEVSWRVKLAPESIAVLEAAKKAVQEATGDGPASRLAWGGAEWIVLPKGGRRHQFLLENELVRLAVSKCQNESLPALHFTVRARTCWAKGRAESWALCERIARAVHDPDAAGPARVDEDGSIEDDPDQEARSLTTRTDLAADFLGMPFDDMDPAEWVGRPRKRGRYFQIDPDDLASADFANHRRKTGDSFGKNAIMARVYDKTLEIFTQSPDKVFLFAFWKKCDACGESQAAHEAALGHDGEPVGYVGCEKTGCAAFVLDEAGFMDERPCAACDASGKGERVIRCRTCRGRPRKKKGPCVPCAGTGRATVTETTVSHKACRGKGCNECKGTGRVTAPLRCKVCKGKKTTADTVWRVEVQLKREVLKEFTKAVERTCPSCAGVGSRIYTRDCKRCVGEGSRACGSCAAGKTRTGRSCTRCKGAGRVECLRCSGRGRFEKNKLCKRCDRSGVRVERPKVEELADPSSGRLVVATGRKGARNVGEDLALELDTLEGLNRSLKAMWRYCVGGGRGVRPWLSWRKPTENEQPSRWPLREEWALVQAVEWGEDQRDELVRVKRVSATFDRAIVQVNGFLSSCAAYSPKLSLDDDDVFTKTCGRVWNRAWAYSERQTARTGETFSAKAKRKRVTAALWGLFGAEARTRAVDVALAQSA